MGELFDLVDGVKSAYDGVISAYDGVIAAIGVIGLISGAIQCFFGYRIFRVIISVIGFVVGALIGALIGVAASEVALAVILAIAIGALGAWLALKLYKLGVFIVCFAAGALLGAAFGVMAGDAAVAVVLAGLFGIALGVLGVIFTTPVIILITGVGGGMSMGIGLVAMIGGAGLLLGIVFSILGIIVQFHIGKKKKALPETAAYSDNLQAMQKKRGTAAGGLKADGTAIKQKAIGIGQAIGNGSMSIIASSAAHSDAARFQNTRTERSLAEQQAVLVKHQTPLWKSGLPIILTELQIVKNAEDKVCLSLGFQNLSPDEIIGIFMSVRCYDLLRQELTGIEKLAIQDIHVASGALWFSDVPLALPDENTRRCTVMVKNVVMADGTIWSDDSESALEPIAPQPTLALDADLKNELFRIMASNHVPFNPSSIYKFEPEQQAEYWNCACGQLNTGESCLACGIQRELLFASISPQYLIEHREARLLEEKRLDEERRKELEARVENVKQQVISATVQTSSTVKTATGDLVNWLNAAWKNVKLYSAAVIGKLKKAPQQGIVCACGEVNPPDSAFCLICGALLTKQEEPIVQGLKCTCGEVNPLDSVFCLSCGKQLVERDAATCETL